MPPNGAPRDSHDTSVNRLPRSDRHPEQTSARCDYTWLCSASEQGTRASYQRPDTALVGNRSPDGLPAMPVESARTGSAPGTSRRNVTAPVGGSRDVRPPMMLRPALVIAERMKTGPRLGVLALLLVIPGVLATYSYSAEIGARIALSTLEIEGTRVVVPALQALADSTGGGTPDLAGLRRTARQHPGLNLNQATAQLPDTVGDSPAERLSASEALNQLITDTGNNSNLILDPDLDSFYVMDILVVQLPKALLATAKAAAFTGAHPDLGSGVNPADAALAARAVLAGELSTVAASLRSDVQTATKNSTAQALGAALASVEQAADVTDNLAKALTNATRRGVTSADIDGSVVALRATAPHVTATLDLLLSRRVDVLRNERLRVLAVTIGGFVIASWFAVGVLWRTRHDVVLAVTGVTAVADGDFAERPLPSGRDELGEIGAALVSARSRLVRQEEELNQAQSLRQAQMRASFLHQRHAEVRLRERAQTIINESTRVIADELRIVTSQVGEVAAASSTIDARVSETDAVTASVVGHARRAEGVISALEYSLRRVADIAATVNGIARQTRLLALNATIEAARAGQLGLGFTVVADEVKQLATTTARSTDQIRETITSLEHDAAEVSETIAAMVVGIGSIGDSATVLSTLATDQERMVHRLAGRVDETRGRVEDMSGLAAQLERRRSDRIAALGEVSLQLPGHRQPVSVKLVNLSAGGLRCSLDPAIELDVGDLIDAELHADAGPISVHAQVTYRGDVSEPDQVGLQFLTADSETSKLIDGYIDQLLDGPDRGPD